MKTPSEIFNVLGTKKSFSNLCKTFSGRVIYKTESQGRKTIKSKTLCVNNPDFLKLKTPPLKDEFVFLIVVSLYSSMISQQEFFVFYFTYYYDLQIYVVNDHMEK